MLFVVLALAARAATPAVLSSGAACQVAHGERMPVRKRYSLRGSYGTSTHGAAVLLPGCDMIAMPARLFGSADAKVSAWHDAYQKKCHTILMGDGARGALTGTFVRKKMTIPLSTETVTMNEFEIDEIDSPELDIESITCPTATN